MEWTLFWTWMAQMTIALVLLSLPASLFVTLVFGVLVKMKKKEEDTFRPNPPASGFSWGSQQ